VPFHSTTYQVLIASPSDMPDARQAAVEVVNDWNALNAAAEGVVLLPVMWETHTMPETGVRPQAAINRQIVQACDLLVGMFWTRFGTSTGVAPSGTVEEIEQFVAANKPAMLYFSCISIDPSKIDQQQHASCGSSRTRPRRRHSPAPSRRSRNFAVSCFTTCRDRYAN
jgi:hypothetical protein